MLDLNHHAAHVQLKRLVEMAVEYSITPLGRTLQQPFVALVAWALEHGGGIELAQHAFDERALST